MLTNVQVAVFRLAHRRELPIVGFHSSKLPRSASKPKTSSTGFLMTGVLK
jgi:hypothetical protein